MKIIDNTPHYTVVKQKICQHCGVTLEYVPNDVKAKTESDWYGNIEYIEYLECPNCKAELVV